MTLVVLTVVERSLPQCCQDNVNQSIEKGKWSASGGLKARRSLAFVFNDLC
jgi:hypothetical protein